MDTFVSVVIQTNAVMIALYIVSVAAFAVIMERAWAWTRDRVRESDAHRLLAAAGGRDSGARRAATAGGRGPLRRLYLEWLEGADKAALEETAAAEASVLERNLWLLDCAATVSPLLGILGTLVGMCQTFGGFGAITSLDPLQMAQGISLALQSSVVGLVIAISSVVCAYFCRKAAAGGAAVLADFADALVAVPASASEARQ